MANGHSISAEDANRALRVLKAVWMIVSARHEDAVAVDVSRLGERLRTAIDAGDWVEAAAAADAVRSWMATMAGVVTSRMVNAFEGE